MDKQGFMIGLVIALIGFAMSLHGDQKANERYLRYVEENPDE